MAIIVAIFVGALLTTEAIIAAVILTLEIVAAVWVAYETGLLEFVFSLFGVEAEDVIQTQVITQRVIPEDAGIASLITRVALEHQKDSSVGIMDRVLAHSSVARGRYHKYYNYGKDSYVHGLPTSNLKAIVIDKVAIKACIDLQEGVSSTVLTAKIGTPTDVEYVNYKLQETYTYKPYINELPYSGDIYNVTEIDYNYTYDRYDVLLTSYETRVATETITTTVTVTNINPTTDNVHTVVTKRVVVVGTKSGPVSDTTITLNTTDEVVAIGTVVSSINSVETITTQIDYVYNTASLIVAAFTPDRYYVVKYEVALGEWYIWLYKENSGGCPALDGNDYYYGGLTLMPVVAIRNAGVNVNSDKESDLYKQTVKILKYTGIDLDAMTESLEEAPSIGSVEDAFIHFGLNPSDTSPVVSKTLFLMFDYLFSDISLYDNNEQAYLATIQEGPFNAALAWESQTRTIRAGVIGALGTYKHSISGKTLTLQKQEEPEYYVEIVLVGMSTLTLIDRQGLVGGVTTDLGDPNFSIMLASHFLDKLSPLEQYELFSKSLLMSIYAADVQHLEFYETEAFMNLLKVVAIVISIWTMGSSMAAMSAAGATVGTMVGTMAMNMALMFGASMLLRLVLESTDSLGLRLLAIIAYAYLMGSAGGMGESTTMATELTDVVTQFATTVGLFSQGLTTMFSIDYEQIQAEMSAWSAKVDEVTAEHASVRDSMKDMISVTDVAQIMGIEGTQAYLYGVDAMMYKAINVQYNYDVLYNYDRYTTSFYTDKLRLGIV